MPQEGEVSPLFLQLVVAHTVTVKILLLPPNARKERSSLDVTAGFDLCLISFAPIPVKTKYIYIVLIVKK